MNRIVRSTIQALLLVTLAASAVAQDAKEAEAVKEPKEVKEVKEVKEPEGPNVEALIASLEEGMSRLQMLGEQIDTVPALDREALLFRRDKRSFKLLLDLDELARVVAQMPVDDPQRVEVEKRLNSDLNSAGSTVIRRINELGERIVTHGEDAESLSGSQRILTEAYVSNLEKLRVEYYEALVNVLKGREALGLPTDQTLQELQQLLYLHAEILVGRVEFIGLGLSEMQVRLDGDPQNADIGTAVKEFSSRHQLFVQRLKKIAALMDRLGLDNTLYKAVLIQQGKDLSVSDLESEVVVSLVSQGVTALRETVAKKTPDLLFNLLIFVLILLLFRALSRLARRAVVAACNRPSIDMSTLLKDILASVTGGTIMVIGILMALSQIGISLAPMLAGLGVAGFVVGFAMQDTLANFAAGGMILAYRPYDVDDFVEVAGASGLVKKMSLVSTTINTFDNQTLVVPNSKIWGDVIKNVTAQKLRRVDLEFGIGYGDDIEHAERVLGDIIASHEMVLKKPASLVKLQTLADSSVNFVVRPWVKTEDYWSVYWDITREVKMRFDREGISIPFPQRDVHLYNPQA